MITPLAKHLRIIRMKNDDLLYNMADKLKIKASYLSTIENGKKYPPLKWEWEIPALYNLNDSEKEEFIKLLYEQRKQPLDEFKIKDNYIFEEKEYPEDVYIKQHKED